MHIVIAGAGPAGAACALGLRAMGFEVTVISLPRGFVAREAISERVLQGLHNAGLRHARDTVNTPSPRLANWNGIPSQANTERLVQRELFDRALLTDLEDAGVDLLPGRISKTTEGKVAANITVQGTDSDGRSFSLEGQFFVDARGRSAPGDRQARMRGPETVSLLQAWQGEACDAGSSAVSFREGWAWMARFADGSRYTQLTLAAEGIPPKAQLPDFFFPLLQDIEQAAPYCRDATPTGDIAARSSTAILQCDPTGERSMRIGDAALAVDPLSGNGIFQSLSTGLIAPRVINTILKQPRDAELARQFYRERVSHAFMRFARMGRDFYQQERRWEQEPFWQQRQSWPDQLPMHEPVKPEQLQVERRPVVAGGLISEREVVVTPDQPLGIWHLMDIELAPLVNAWQAQCAQGQQPDTGEDTARFVAEFLQQQKPGHTQQQLQAITAWVEHHLQ